MINVEWPEFKNFVNNRGVSIQYLNVNNGYYLMSFDGQVGIKCLIPNGTDAQADFESNFKALATTNVSPNTVVTTQFEWNNKDLKLASVSAAVNSSGVALTSIKIPGTFGSGGGRYILGGYAISEDYDKDDRAICWVSDDDRNICAALGLATDGSADVIIQSMGILPAPFGIAFPQYPAVKNYYDDEVDASNQGWYFWPLATGGSTPPVGEVDIEALAGYGFLPSSFYLKIQYTRKTLTTGGVRINLEWGQESMTPAG